MSERLSELMLDLEDAARQIVTCPVYDRKLFESDRDDARKAILDFFSDETRNHAELRTAARAVYDYITDITKCPPPFDMPNEIFTPFESLMLAEDLQK